MNREAAAPVIARDMFCVRVIWCCRCAAGHFALRWYTAERRRRRDEESGGDPSSAGRPGNVAAAEMVVIARRPLPSERNVQ